MRMRFFRGGGYSAGTVLCALSCLMLSGEQRSPSAQAQTGKQGGSFLYVLDCGPDLYKFDAATGKPVGSFDLTQRTKLIVTHGDVAGSTADGCPTNGAVYTSSDSVFTTLAPTTGSVDVNGKQRYHLLRFHLPELKLLGSVMVPGAYETAPKLELSSTGAVQVLTLKDAFSFAGGKLVQTTEGNMSSIAGSQPVAGGSPMLEIDVTGYDLSKLKLNPQPDRLVYTPLERSGSTVLVQFVRPGQGLAYAAMDSEAKRIVALNPGFASTADNFHLAPGGKSVLVQEATFAEGIQVAQTTDRLALLDATTGVAVRIWSDKVAAHGSVKTITPSGAAVLFSGDRYHFVPLNMKFPPETIHSLRGDQSAPYFYADR